MVKLPSCLARWDSCCCCSATNCALLVLETVDVVVVVCKLKDGTETLKGVFHKDNPLFTPFFRDLPIIYLQGAHSIWWNKIPVFPLIVSATPDDYCPFIDHVQKIAKFDISNKVKMVFIKKR